MMHTLPEDRLQQLVEKFNESRQILQHKPSSSIEELTERLEAQTNLLELFKDPMQEVMEKLRSQEEIVAKALEIKTIGQLTTLPTSKKYGKGPLKRVSVDFPPDLYAKAQQFRKDHGLSWVGYLILSAELTEAFIEDGGK